MKERMTKTKRSHHYNWYTAATMAVIAGILYCSWPLGYYLNPQVSAHGLASELGAVGQPYNWLFILLDVLTGIIVLLVAIMVWRACRKVPIWWLKPVLISYALFGVFTALDAVLPMHCVPSLRRCPGLGQDHLLIVHGIASISASAFLFITALGMWHIGQIYHRLSFMWIIMLAWALFGLMSLVFFFVPGPGYLAQHYFITLCSFWIALLPYVTRQSLAHVRARA